MTFSIKEPDGSEKDIVVFDEADAGANTPPLIVLEAGSITTLNILYTQSMAAESYRKRLNKYGTYISIERNLQIPTNKTLKTDMPKTNHHTLSLSSIFFLLLLCSFPTLHAQQLAVKTNGLMLAAMAPNIGCEFVVGERSSIDISAFGAVNIYGNKAK